MYDCIKISHLLTIFYFIEMAVQNGQGLTFECLEKYKLAPGQQESIEVFNGMQQFYSNCIGSNTCSVSVSFADRILTSWYPSYERPEYRWILTCMKGNNQNLSNCCTGCVAIINTTRCGVQIGK